MADSDFFKTKARMLKASKIAARLVYLWGLDRAVREATVVMGDFSGNRSFRDRIEAEAIPTSESASEATWFVVLSLLQVAKAGAPLLAPEPKALKEGDRIKAISNIPDYPIKGGTFKGRTSDGRVVWQEDGLDVLHTSIPVKAGFRLSSMFTHADGAPIDAKASGFPA